MRQINNGLEYKVYDAGAGRVLKRRRSLPNRAFVSFVHSVRARRLRGWPPILRILLPTINGVPAIAARIATMSPEERKLFGNIKMEGGNNYSQDVVMPLRDYIESHSFAENITALANYVTLIRRIWSLGIGDPYYNFTWNAGVYPDGTVVQIDIGDLLTDAAVIGETAKKQIWLLTGNKQIADERLRAESAVFLNAGLSYETFLELWPKDTVSGQM